MLTPLQQNIETIRQQNRIADAEFRAVDIHLCHGVEKRVVNSFCYADNAFGDRLWQNFKHNTYAVKFEKSWPIQVLAQLVDPSEKVFLFVNEPIEGQTKFWFYEGTIKPIVFVLGESFADEVYIVSKKYDWLLCINHHDVLIATGEMMPAKLKMCEEQMFRV